MRQKSDKKMILYIMHIIILGNEMKNVFFLINYIFRLFNVIMLPPYGKKLIKLYLPQLCNDIIFSNILFSIIMDDIVKYIF